MTLEEFKKAFSTNLRTSSGSNPQPLPKGGRRRGRRTSLLELTATGRDDNAELASVVFEMLDVEATGRVDFRAYLVGASLVNSTPARLGDAAQTSPNHLQENSNFSAIQILS